MHYSATLGNPGTAARRSTTGLAGRTVGTLLGIPSGQAGAVATVRKMRELVQQAIRDPQQRVREAALAIIGSAGFVDQARRLQSWVQSSIRYVRDPPDLELVQTPQYTMQKTAGDCDDQSVLLASLLQATGHPVRFIAVGLNGGPFSHVLVQTLIGESWYGAETILKKPLGWMPPGITSQYILKV